MIINGLIGGNYIAEVFDSVGCYDSVHVSIQDLIGPGCSEISGFVVADDAADCILNAGDSLLSGVMIEATPGPYYTITDAVGKYEFHLPYGTYNIAELSAGSYVDHCNGSSFSVTTSALDSIKEDNNFYDTVLGAPNAKVVNYNGFIRPGFTTSHWVDLENLSITTMSGTLYALLPSGITYTGASTAPDAISGDTLSWNITSLIGLDNELIQIDGVASGVFIGQVVNICVWFDADQTDVDLSNNTYCIAQTVIGSFDPNDKAASPVGDILLTDETLTYMIRFQNTYPRLTAPKF